MIEKVTMKDRNSICKLWVGRVKESIPFLTPKPSDMLEFLVKCIVSNTALVLKSETGLLIAVESSNEFFEKRRTEICMLWAESHSECDELLEECMKWFESRRGSLVISYASPVTTIADEALLNAGFANSGTMLVRRRYDGVH